MCVEINLNNYSEDACTCKYVHAGQNYIVQIRYEFISLTDPFMLVHAEREREREDDDSSSKRGPPSLP